jgi:hypothetical protein
MVLHASPVLQPEHTRPVPHHRQLRTWHARPVVAGDPMTWCCIDTPCHSYYRYQFHQSYPNKYPSILAALVLVSLVSCRCPAAVPVG